MNSVKMLVRPFPSLQQEQVNGYFILTSGGEYGVLPVIGPFLHYSPTAAAALFLRVVWQIAQGVQAVGRRSVLHLYLRVSKF